MLHLHASKQISHILLHCSIMINQIIRNLAPLNDNPMLDTCPHQDMQWKLHSRPGQYSHLIIQITLLAHCENRWWKLRSAVTDAQALVTKDTFTHQLAWKQISNKTDSGLRLSEQIKGKLILSLFSSIGNLPRVAAKFKAMIIQQEEQKYCSSRAGNPPCVLNLHKTHLWLHARRRSVCPVHTQHQSCPVHTQHESCPVHTQHQFKSLKLTHAKLKNSAPSEHCKPKEKIIISFWKPEETLLL
jgi:hypothetical protein